MRETAEAIQQTSPNGILTDAQLCLEEPASRKGAEGT